MTKDNTDFFDLKRSTTDMLKDKIGLRKNIGVVLNLILLMDYLPLCAHLTAISTTRDVDIRHGYYI